MTHCCLESSIAKEWPEAVWGLQRATGSTLVAQLPRVLVLGKRGNQFSTVEQPSDQSEISGSALPHIIDCCIRSRAGVDIISILVKE